MTPKFTTPCFVRVEDADKRKELTKSAILIGRTVIGSENKYLIAEANTSTCVAIWSGLEGQPTNALRACKFIDCGTNIDLFLALAGMRRDTDKGQWYVFLSTGKLERYTRTAPWPVPEAYGLRKATAAEIIEHFNNKIK